MQTPSSLASLGFRRRWLVAATVAPLVLAGAVVLSDTDPASAASLNKCAHRDNGLPVVNKVVFSPSSVDVTSKSQRVKMTVHARDTGGPGKRSGVSAVSAWVSPQGQDSTPITLTRKAAGVFSRTFTVPVGAADGQWKVRMRYLIDHAGNDAFEDSDDPVAAKTRNAVDAATLNVVSVPDTERPSATSVTLKPRTVNTKRRAKHVQVTVAATDQGSGVGSVKVGAERGRHYRSATLKLRADGKFSGKLRIPRWRGTGKWKLTTIEVTDRAGNVQNNHASAIKKLGHWHFRVISKTDNARPKLRWVKHPKRVDARHHSKTMKFSVRLTDRDSGVSAARIVFAGRKAPLKHVSGTSKNGIWKGKLGVGKCRNMPKSSLVRVDAWDRGDNKLQRLRGKIRIVSGDHQIYDPQLARHRDLPTSGPVVVRFPEAVNGLSTRSTEVRHLTGSDLNYVFYGNPIDGKWTCTTSKGKTTSCKTGKVRKASWVPDAPLTPSESYRLVLNPEGNLDVTDLAGNPYYRYALYFGTT